jgi:LSD1 subclass zinc finger protein
MRDQPSIVCVNCGTMLEAPEGAAGVICPVCQFYNDLSVSATLGLTPDALEAQLGDLIARARASGLTLDDIVRVLRDELEFAAELASGGRHLYVQILDLGPLESQGLQRPVRDRGALLRGRSTTG